MATHHDGLERLDSRRSVPSRLLAEPGPTSEQLQRLLRSAIRVPDHGKLVPWRFLCIRGDARHALGQMLATRCLERDPQASAAVVEKDRQRFCFAPLVVAVIARITSGHKVPEQEQLLSGGAVCFALLQASQAMGFGAQWLTGWAAYDRVITARLGLAENERVLGFVHIGSRRESIPERERPDPSLLLTEFEP